MVALDEHFRHSATAVRTHWHPVGKSVPSAQSADHVPTLAARPLFTSGTSVVNINGPGTPMAGWHFGISECPRKGHRPLATNGRAYFFGNAPGFNASTALTTYLYSSTPFDAASGNYYDHARFYNAGIGEFTQTDYGYSGNLSNPMPFLPYAFTGGDPINMLDLNGHFSIPDVRASISIMTAIVGIAPVAAAGLYSLKAGLPDALGFGGFFEANLANLPGGVGMVRLLVGLEVAFYPRAGEVQVSLFGPAGIDFHIPPNIDPETALGWLTNKAATIGFEIGAFQAWYWGEPQPSMAGIAQHKLIFAGYELDNGMLAGYEHDGNEQGMFAGFTFTVPQAGLFGSGGGEYNFAPFHMSESAMISAASAGEGLFTLGLSQRFAESFNLGGLAASVVDGGLTAAWVGWMYQ